MLESIEEFFIPEGKDADRERGQILLILALAMVGLLVAAGLAIDGGVLFMRRAQLERAVDAAALAGVVRLEDTSWDELTKANTRGQQVLAANTFETSNPGPSEFDFDNENECTLENYDYCGSADGGYLPGTLRYTVEAETQAEVFFMQLVGFDSVPLRSTATAEYQPLVDIYASEALQSGVLRSSNQAVFGPDSCIHMGDAYSPTYDNTSPAPYNNPYYEELNGAYNYRIRIPDSYIYNADGSVNHDKIRIEIFDPDASNQADGTVTTYDQEGNSDSGVSCTRGRHQPCLHDVQLTGDGDDTPFWWFVRVEENRYPAPSPGQGCGGSTYIASNNTETEYRLYYLEQQDDGSLVQVDLAYYVGKIDDGADTAEAQATDLNWISPGAEQDCPEVGGAPDYDDSDNCELMPAFTYNDVYDPLAVSGDVFSEPEPPIETPACSDYLAGHAGDPIYQDRTCSTQTNGNFIVQLINNGGDNSETPDIYVDPQTGRRDLYLDVRVLDGASENGYEIWAGPPRTDGLEYEVPAFVNARQMYITRQQAEAIGDDPDFHSSDGAGVFGIGHLPMNSNQNNRVDIPLAYLGPEFGGQDLTVSLFDADSGHSPPVSFWFEGIPRESWTACFADDPDGSGDAADSCADPLPDGPGGAEEHYNNGGPALTPLRTDWAPMTFTIPTEETSGTGTPFFGGILYVSYDGGQDDTFGWKLTIDSRPYLVE